MQQNESETESEGTIESEAAVIRVKVMHYVCPRCRRIYVQEPPHTVPSLSISFHAADQCLGAFCLYCLIETIRALVPELITWTPRDNAAPDAPEGAQRG